MVYAVTLLLVGLCFFWSYLWCYYQFYRNISLQFKGLKSQWFGVIPSLVLGPLIILISFKFFKINIIFPLYQQVSFQQLLLHCLVPSWILLVSSGFLFRCCHEIQNEIDRWKLSPFVHSGRSFGMSRAQILKPLVVHRVYFRVWLSSFPWFFGELIVVESIFNIQGLGTSIWLSLRQMDMVSLKNDLLLMGLCYGVLYGIFLQFQKKLGQYLQSYS